MRNSNRIRCVEMWHAAVALFLVRGALAFSPHRQIISKHHTSPGQVFPLPNRNYYLSSVASTDQHPEEMSLANANDADRSEIEQFVSDMRELYGDLENGGGTIRREMDAVRFTYVAPAHQFTTHSAEENRQLNGAWRLQAPAIYGANEDWTEIHHNIIEERMDQNGHSKPPPLLVYLPGLDGFGISATAQYDDLSSSFEFWRMTVDKKNERVSFSDLLRSVVKFVKDATSSAEFSDSPREVILAGESFGGLLTCAVAMALENIEPKTFVLKGMVLINPATSFDETSWQQVVPLLTSLRYLETQEEITDDNGNFRLAIPQGLPTPYSVLGGMALAATIPDSQQYSKIVDFILQSSNTSSNENMLSASSDGFRILAEYLPAKILEQRVLEWLPVGTSVVNSVERLSKLKTPTLIIGGSDDNMLPTKEEVDRLGELLPDCVKMEISGAGHFVLDTRVNLTEVILDSHIDPFDAPKVDPIVDWALPPDHVVNDVIKKRVVPQREKTSPVFFSTDPLSGERRRGLSHVPSTKKPLLLVGNHQLFGQDLGMIISELLEERGIVARGLAHPVALGVAEGGIGPEEPTVRKQKRRWEFNEDNQFEADLFKLFGAVKVSPRNFYRLLQTNQTVLLFPGGVKEALHGKGEDYQLFWPEKTDFVRLAAKFNATIVPLSAIGAADSADILLDASELLNLPFGIGENLKNFSSSTSSARYDVDNQDELFVPPLALPKPIPARHYFLFGKAYDTSTLDPRDQDACRDVYKGLEEEVKHDIQALVEARKEDPYAFDGIRRTSYRRVFGKDPPTFPLQSLSPSARMNGIAS
ncbi:hypothetical protein ACHAXR_008527 [Thalassiosira sp. AJA248-18]